MALALLENDTPVGLRVCASCRWSRDQNGTLFFNADRAFCVQPDIRTDDGSLIPCERQRTTPSSQIMKICGGDGIFYEPRT